MSTYIKDKSQIEQDVLTKVKGYFEKAYMNPIYQKWYTSALNNWRFYEGDQWAEEEIDALSEKGQPAIVINKIAPKIDNLSGVEVAGRTRVVYRSRSGDVEEEKKARQLSDVALYVAEKAAQDVEVSFAFKAGLITGMGWLDVGVEPAEEGPRIFNTAENELDVVWDTHAKQDDYSDAQFVCRQRWLGEAEFNRLFPKHKGVFVNGEAQLYAAVDQGFLSKEPEIGYVDAERERVRVVEVQYKQMAKEYKVTLETGEIFVTFDKAKAQITNAKVEQAYKPRVYVAYYVGDTLLSHQPLNYAHGMFTLVPFYFKRERQTGCPYGLVKAAIDPQREFNKRRSKAMHLLNTAQVIADVDAVDDPQVLAREAARPDGIILKRPGKDLRIMRNTDLAASQVSVMEKASYDIQEVMGVFDEAMGQKTNATSGAAIRVRQQASNMNQMFAYDALRRTKKILGVQIMSHIRQFFNNNMMMQITDSFLPKDEIRLTTTAGEPLTMLDVRTSHFDVHVEEVKDVHSSRELELDQLEALRQAGIPVPAEMLIDATSLKDKEKLKKYLAEQQNKEH